jgi:hypothetical protein
MLYRVTALCFTEQSQRDCVSPFFELARVLVRLSSRCPQHRKPESRHRVTGCETSRSRLRC